MKLFLIFLLASIFPLQANGGQTMNEEAINRAIISVYAKDYGCADRLEAEKMDGLIIIDFRKLIPPSFATGLYGWDFRSRADNYFWFEWYANSNSLNALIEAYVFPSYEDARKKFSGAIMVTAMNLPWIPCRKKIGTVCADGPNLLDHLFFVHKNVFVKITGGGQLPNGDYFRDELAVWLSNILQNHPRSNTFPETLDNLPEAKPETKIPAPSSVLGGQLCSKAGWWFTPAKADSGRYFKEGELMPDFKTDYGQTIWQWQEPQPEGK